MASDQPAHHKANFDICNRKLLKIGIKEFNRKIYFTYFHEFVFNTLSKMYVQFTPCVQREASNGIGNRLVFSRVFYIRGNLGNVCPFTD